MRYLKQLILLSLICGMMFLSTPTLSFAQIYTSEHGKAKVFSKATLENFTGKSNYLVGQINLSDSRVDFYLDLSTLSTGVELRDEHMQEEFLETAKYPFAQFSGKLVTPFDTTSSDTQKVKVKGDFKLHGISRNIEVIGEMVKKGHQLFIHANWQLDLPDYNIKIPQVLFMKVSQTQKLSITARMEEKEKQT